MATRKTSFLNGGLIYAKVCIVSPPRSTCRENAIEIEGEGLFKLWYAWRAAWGRMPKVVPKTSANEVPPSSAVPASARSLAVSEQRIEAGERLMSKLARFTQPQCVIRNEQEALAYVEHRNNEPFSTRNRF